MNGVLFLVENSFYPLMKQTELRYVVLIFLSHKNQQLEKTCIYFPTNQASLRL